MQEASKVVQNLLRRGNEDAVAQGGGELDGGGEGGGLEGGREGGRGRMR